MKLFSILILYKGEPAAHVLKASYDLTSFGFFQRGTVQEFINLTVAQRNQLLQHYLFVYEVSLRHAGVCVCAIQVHI